MGIDLYKKSLEDSLLKYRYLYDGDVISSKDCRYTEYLSHSIISPSVLISCVNEIYDKSIKSLFDKSINIISEYKNISNLEPYLSGINPTFNPSSMFCTDNGLKTFGYLSKSGHEIPYNKEIQHISRINSCLIYRTSLIEDAQDDVKVYLVDRSIQSLVYSIQNMDYHIDKDGDFYKHSVDYKYYECDFRCYRLNIKSTSSLRDYKIDRLFE